MEEVVATYPASQPAMTSPETLLDQGFGYGILVSLSIAFGLIIIAAVWMQERYLSEKSDRSEMFMVANRSVGVGLTASAVFSSWMWIDEIIFSVTFAYNWGLAAPVWYASGISCQIALMAFMGIIAKIKVPYAHTSMEFIRKRYGGVGHVVYIVLNLINNVFGCASMLLTAILLFQNITGMHPVAATFLLPVGVVIYTAVGGLKATFLTDFLHTTIALTLLIYFTVAVLTNEHVGGISGLYNKVSALDVQIDGNYAGSLLTFKSHDAIVWSVVLRIGNLALVVMDTAFWQKSFASDVRATVPGYTLASAAIIAVPWGVGTVIGLTGRVIEDTPVFKALLPDGLTTDLVGNGMVLPLVLKSLLGDSAVRALLVLTFMAVTSTMSSSMIAVSSLVSFDIFRTYLKPSASDRQILRVSHGAVVVHGFVIAAWTVMMNYSGANGTWTTYFLPVVTCPGVFPLLLTLLWSRQTTLAAVLSPILGLGAGVGVWLGFSKAWYGAITVETTDQQMPSLWGSIIALFSPLLFSVIISLARPNRFDWNVFLEIDLIKDTEDTNSSTPLEVANLPQTKAWDHGEEAYKTSRAAGTLDLGTKSDRESGPISMNVSSGEVVHPFDAKTLRHMGKWKRIAGWLLVLNVVVTILLWPLPFYRDYIFGQQLFSGWVAVSVLWQFFAVLAVVIYPVWDGRSAISNTVKGIIGDLKKFSRRGTHSSR